MTPKPDWSGSSGDAWSRWWPATDRGLTGVAAALDPAIIAAAPSGPFRALDVGCGPGSTALALAAARPDADILGCDIAESLVAIARDRAAGRARLTFIVKDAEQAARDHRPFELIFSRHGVMFFDDPPRAFRSLRTATCDGGALVFSCFRDWHLNPWAVELSEAVAGEPVPPPGRESGGFAFADRDYVADLLATSGWAQAEAQPVDFTYEVAGDQAHAFFTAIGPAARVIETVDEAERAPARDRLREAIARRQSGTVVRFPGAAWIWTARADA